MWAELTNASSCLSHLWENHCFVDLNISTVALQQHFPWCTFVGSLCECQLLLKKKNCFQAQGKITLMTSLGYFLKTETVDILFHRPDITFQSYCLELSKRLNSVYFPGRWVRAVLSQANGGTVCIISLNTFCLPLYKTQASNWPVKNRKCFD